VIGLMALGGSSAVATQKTISARAAWVKLPADGDSTAAFVTIENPTMYDVYVVSASSTVVGAITFRHGAGATAKELEELVVPAFGTLEMTPEGVHLWLSKLKKPLADKDTVEIALTTDGNVAVEVKAVVRK
jgi:periplasmic copper chaperone A